MVHLVYFYFFVIIAAIITIFFAMYYSEKYRIHSSWSGIIQDKNSKDYLHKGQRKYVFMLTISKDNGEKLTLDVDETTYKSVEVGDRVKKEKGQYNPNKYA